jgi:hypothetical protein
MNETKPGEKTSLKSRVISIKLPRPEYDVVIQFLDFKGVSFGQFIRKIVQNYLHLEEVILEEDDFLVQRLLAYKQNREIFDPNRITQIGDDFEGYLSLRKVSIRLQKDQLAYWDQYCKKHFYTRTGLIRAAIHEFFHPRQQTLTPTKTDRINIRNFLNAMIYSIGQIEETRLIALFNQYDPKMIFQILNQLENQGKIGRKLMERGRIMYVSTRLSEEVEEEPLMSRFIARIL